MLSKTRRASIHQDNADTGAEVAKDKTYLGDRPVERRVPKLPRAQRPRPERKEAAYFTDDELPRLFTEIPPGVYDVLFNAALKTGMREGELLALRWADVDLVGAVIRMRCTYTDGHLGTPTNHERRDVDLTADFVEMLGGWWGECGRPLDDKLVFPGETATGYISPTTILRRELYPAMERAGIARKGPTGAKRTFHSLRHTYARIALENGGELTWLSRPRSQLDGGHGHGVRTPGPCCP